MVQEKIFTLTRKCLTETQVFFPINQILNSFFKMGKFTFTFIFVTAFIAGTFGAPRTQRSTGKKWSNQTKPRMLCNGNRVLPHLQMGVAVTGFFEDFRYSLHNS